jgi:myosin-5
MPDLEQVEANFCYLTVLQAIKLRYAQKEIYTYSGIVLIATNPFAKVDSLYVPGMVQIYAGKSRAEQAPHLFAIAEEAYSYVTVCLYVT